MFIELPVEGSAWVQITPVPGYSYRIVQDSDGPFAPGTLCFSGGLDRNLSTCNLGRPGSRVKIRFRFGSGSVTEDREGWYIDDLVLDPGPAVVDPASAPNQSAEIRDMSVCPNPFNLTTKIPFRTGRDAERLRVDIVDVTGGKIRGLLDGPVPPGEHSLAWDGGSDGGHPVGGGVLHQISRRGRGKPSR
jgi:hypothetical protein